MGKADYILKNNMWDDVRMNRLIKTITVNAKIDRKESEDLLASCKEAMLGLNSLLQDIPTGDDSSMQSADTFHKLISAAATALSSMGNANEKLLKIATLLQKYRLKEMDNEKGSDQDARKSLFSSLDALTKKTKNG